MPFDAGVRHKIEREYLAGDRALKVRPDIEGPVEAGERFVDPAKSGETEAQYEVSLIRIGRNRESFLAIEQCLGNLLGLEQDIGAPEPPIHVVGCEGDCPIAIPHGFVKSLKLPECSGAVRQRRGIVRLDRERAVQACESLVIVAQTAERRAAAVVGCGQVCVNCERLIVALERFLVQIEGRARVTEIGQGEGVAGPQGESLSIALAGLVVTFQPVQRHAQAHMGFGRSGVCGNGRRSRISAWS